jgi:hypothetical protein
MTVPSPSHPAVVKVHEAASVVVAHQLAAPNAAFWQRWFEKPTERHLADEIRAFVVALDFLLDVPPQMLSPADLVSIREDAERVIKKVEAAIEDPAIAAAGLSPALTPAVYVIRARFEELYRRGAFKLEN